jgi:G3E family GTPase
MLERTPAGVTVVAGFLGAGKTTLVNRLVGHLEGVRTAVVVNDFGSAIVDAAQIVGVQGIVELPNGCICCTIRNDITSTLLTLIEREDGPRHVIVETSGVADPRPVAASLLELQRLGGIRLDGVLVVVDAEHLALAGEHARLQRAQIQAADAIVLNKIDLVPPERVAEVRSAIASIAPGARIVEAVEADVPKDLILTLEHGPKAGGEHLHDHLDAFTTHTFRTKRPLAWSTLAPILVDLDPGVFRVKGFVQLVERGTDRILLHVVGRRVYVRTVEPWTGEPETELILIGRFDPAAIEARLLSTAP